MGFCTKLFFEQLEKLGLIPYLIELDWFRHCLNGTMLEILVKCHERIVEQDTKIKELEEEKQIYIKLVDYDTKALENLREELYQQRFNNKNNLSIDQKISDEIFRLRDENRRLNDQIRENNGRPAFG